MTDVTLHECAATAAVEQAMLAAIACSFGASMLAKCKDTYLSQSVRASYTSLRRLTIKQRLFRETGNAETAAH